MILLVTGLMFLLAAIPDMIQQTRRCRGEAIPCRGWWTFWSFGMAFIAVAALAAACWMDQDKIVGGCMWLGVASLFLVALEL